MYRSSVSVGVEVLDIIEMELADPTGKGRAQKVPVQLPVAVV